MKSFSEPFLHHSIPSRYENNDNVTLKVVKEISDHQNYITVLLYFGDPHNKIVSCSRDGTIRIWSSETYECLKTIKKHARPVWDSIKLTDEVFLSCSNDLTFRSFNISSYEQEKEFKTEGRVYGLLPLTDDLFVVRSFFNLIIWSYKKEKILKKYCVGQTTQEVYHPLLLSQKYPHCFFVATMVKDETIKLINYETDKVVKEFKGHNKNERIYSLCLFNSKNEEILIACHTAGKMYTYNTSHPQFNTRKRINEIEKDLDSEKYYGSPYQRLTCCFCFNNQYILAGDDLGSVHLYELQETENSIKKIKRRKIHRSMRNYGCIYDLLFLPDRRVMLTCSSDHTIKISRVEGLSLRTNFDVSDRTERIEFLIEYMKCSENSGLFFKVLILQFGDPVEIVVPKTLLLL